MTGDPQTQDVEDSLSHLYKAHTALAHVMMQVDGLVLKLHKMSTQGQIGGHDVCGFSQFLESTASSLQEWIPHFEDATSRVHMQGQRHEQIGPSMAFQGEQEGRQGKQKGGDEERTASQDKVWSCTQSENKLDVPVNVDDMAFSNKESMLSDSPLVPWLERVQFFVLTPMAARKREFSPRILHTSSLKEQEILQSLSSSPISSPRKSCTHAQALEGTPAPSLLLCKPSSKEERVAEPSMCSPLHQQSFESPAILPDMLVTPLPPPKSLVKRYSRFFEAEEQFAGSPSMLLVTPIVKQNASRRKPAEEDESEGMEITEYFTALSQQRSTASSVSTSGRNSCSLPSEASTPHMCHEGLSSNVENGTPLPPQTSLIKRYAQFLHSEEESNETTMDMKMTLSPLFISSPPKTCVLMRPHHEEDSMKRRLSLQTPVLKSPFKTPGLFLRTANGHECDEDMDLTSLKKPWQPPRPPQSVRRTPSSDMQFTRVGRVPASIKRSPFVDLQYSTVRKPGAPLPGEQTLKRELWCRMEAEFTSIANVCKSLFTDNQAEASADTGARKSGMENKENRFVPRGLQQRGLNLYI